MKLFRGRRGAAVLPEPGTRLAPARPDEGPVIVLVGGADHDALDWAAAEAAARGSELQLVYAFRWPPQLLDPLANSAVDLRAREDVEAVLTNATHRARRIAPSLRITTTTFPGRQTQALISMARESKQALVVLGHGRGRLERALARRLSRRTTASLAVIGLSAEGSIGTSAGRVVVGDGSPDAVGFAFRAARRRGTGLTVVQPTAQVEDAVVIWRMAYPDVDVRWELAPGSMGSLVLAESAGAALTVLGPDTHGQGSAYDVLRLARGPVVLVGTAAP